MHNNRLFNRAELYEHAFLQSPIGKGMFTVEGDFVEVNPSFCRVIGYSKEELLALNYRDITFEDDLAFSTAQTRELIEGKRTTLQMIKRYVHKSGTLIWAQVDVSLIFDPAGIPIFTVVQVQDITEKKRTEKLLQENEQKYRSLFENHPDLIVMVGLNGELLSANSSVSGIFGYSEAELRLQRPFLGRDVFAPTELSTYIRHFSSVLSGACEDFEISAFHKDGSQLHLRIILIPMIIDGQMEGVHGIFKDITKFKENSKKLLQTQELYKLISENAQDLITYLTPDGITRYASPSVINLLGYTPEEVIGKPVSALWHPDDVLSHYDSDFLQHSDSDLLVTRVRHRDGHYLWFETLMTIIRNESGDIEKLIGVGRDITERKMAEYSILQREENYRRLVEDSPDAIAISIDRQWVYVNNTLVTLFGGDTKDELIRLPSLSFVHPDYHILNHERMQQVEDGYTAEFIEQILLKKNGEPFVAETLSIPTLYQGEKATHTIIRDISHRKEEQKHLINSEKLAIAGQLAAGIAHEIRNPLTAIKGFIKLMRTSVKPEYIEIIATEVERMESIVTELLLLSKPKEEKFERKNVVHALHQVVTLLESQAHMRSIEIKSSYEVEALYMECDENLLKQAFINFLKNAIEAMSSGGVIHIKLTRTNDRFTIAFIDQGDGISEETLKKLGEPFVTTKETGTGLGFMVSKRIIVSHGGHLNMKSAVGQGTTVEVTFPLPK